MKSLYILAVYMLALTCFSTVHGQTISKEKKISGRFSADRGKLVIDNQYGKLDIHTWDKNEVTVDITITAKASSASDAQEILDKVSIIEPQGNDIRYKTVIAKGKTFQTKSEFSINYVINMPRRHASELINKYGDIEISDVDGKLSIDLSYGNLKTGALRDNDKDIKVGYGSAAITFIETGTIRSSYSKLYITKGGNINVTNEFEKTTIGAVHDLNIDAKYGDVKIGLVDQLKGNIQYAGLQVDKLLKSVQMTVKYSGGAKFDYIGPGVDNININSGFSNLSLGFDNDASLAGDVAVSFGNVSNNSHNLSLTTTRADMPGQNTTYKGKVGSGRGNMTMTVSYGNVVFR
jgi:hypothetical protein